MCVFKSYDVGCVVAILLSIIGNVFSCTSRTIIQAGLSSNDKKMITHSHNRIRQAVALGQTHGQPPAANMMELLWSDELANSAQQWATACVSYIHDPRRHTSQYLVGQNIATRWSRTPPAKYYDMNADFFKDAISKWFNENLSYHFDGILNRPTTHYTQMVWAETSLIGCGFAYYLDEHKHYTKKYVCNYGPSGNVQGEAPYHKGYPNCYNYDLSGSNSYVGLCVKQVTRTSTNLFNHILNH